MYRVLIVDDEEPVLDSFAFMLGGSADFTLAGKARSGYEALRLVHELEPDLVFMDINIPGIDGLEVIADVHKKFSSMVFVLSTAYERFDLAQRAIPLGVFEYLVKPVSKKMFLSTLDKVRTHLEKMKSGADAAGTESPEQVFLRKVLWKAADREEWEKWKEALSLPSDRGIAFMLETAEDAGKWCTLTAEKIAWKYPCRFDVMLNRGLFLVSGDPGRAALEEQLAAALGEILPPDLPYFYGVGEPRQGPELYLSCEEALADLERRRKGTDLLLRERLHVARLRRKIGIAPEEEMRSLFTALWQDIFTGRDFPAAKIKMIPLFMFLLDDISGFWSGNSDAAPPFDPAGEIMRLEDPADWAAWAETAFEKILKEAFLRRSGNFPLPLVKAIGYIREHFAEPVQLSSAAGFSQVSPAYLSRLFSEHLKTSFVDFLTELRMEKAEQLIRESGMSIKEIAFAVGYQDPNYFSKIFRKLRGQSPTEFAEDLKSASENSGRHPQGGRPG
ncbi:MAG: helix-turn-helix domain-containing protein [Treponema sp.]|jgi:two-component system response regulator YesN|nr:helix-turn-helix domain-containing protein [Treponema sp.]